MAKNGGSYKLMLSGLNFVNLVYLSNSFLEKAVRDTVYVTPSNSIKKLLINLFLAINLLSGLNKIYYDNLLLL